MSSPEELHTPTPTFVADLGEAVLRAYREAEPLPSIPRQSTARWTEWGRIAAVLLVGAALGVGAQFASAQVRDARVRSELEGALAAERELQRVRLELANQEVQRVQAAVRFGGLPARTLVEAAREKGGVEFALQRLEIDLAEVRLTNAPPRDDLSAPRVGGRDFVLERLRLQAPLALRAEDGALRLAVEADRRVKLGLDPPGTALDAHARVVADYRERQLIAMRIRLRTRFIQERLSPAEVARLERQETLQIAVGEAAQLLDIETHRLEDAAARRTAGTMSDAEFRRVELDRLERERSLYRLRVELKYLSGMGTP